MSAPTVRHEQMRSASSRAANAGFTLVEVMIALAVLGTAIFVLLETHYGSLRAQDTLRQEVQMRNLMSDAVGLADFPSPRRN